MFLSLCLLLSALSPSSQEICSAPGALPAPNLYLSQTTAQPGDSVQLQCSVFSWAQATRIIFCKDGQEVSSQRVSVEKATYNYKHMVTGGSSGNYVCLYEIRDSDRQVNRSQLSPAQHLSVTEQHLAPIVLATHCTLVLLLLASAPVITFVLKRCCLPQPARQEETGGGTASILGGDNEVPPVDQV